MQQSTAGTLDSPSVAFVSTYPPSRCGLATYTERLVNSLAETGAVSDVAVARVMSSVEHSPSHRLEVVAAFRPGDAAGVRAVSRRLSGYDCVVIQHEYGIYGPNDGLAVRDLADQVTAPVLAVLHTVLPRPSPRKRRILEHLVRRSNMTIVLSDVAAEYLKKGYDVGGAAVTVIPHGSDWPLSVATPALRPVVLTWGLISRTKGLEHAIEAMAQLRDLRPRPLYRVVGRTHPVVLEEEGESYRVELERLVEDLRLQGMVEFEPRYLEADRLAREVATADVVVLPYLSKDQVVSGVLSEALAAGKPVVASRFPHAEELLSTGAGITVDHGDSKGIATALRHFLTDPTAYTKASSEARRVADRFGWGAVISRYGEAIAAAPEAAVPSSVA